MSIIYDALQKTQKNLENKRDATIRNKIQWLDKSLFFIIGGLLFINLIAYYPQLLKRFHFSVIEKKSPVILKPITYPQKVVTPSVTKPATSAQQSVAAALPVKPLLTVATAPLAEVPQPVATATPILPTVQKSTVESHPSVEQLLVNPQATVTVTTDAAPVPDAREPSLSQSAVVPPTTNTVPTPHTNEASYQGKLVLNGVFTSDLEKIALINNQTFHVGDVVEGLKIVSIELDTVRLRDSKGIYVLRTVT